MGRIKVWQVFFKVFKHFFKVIFTYMKELERGVFCLLVYSPNDLNIQGRARPTLVVKIIWVSCGFRGPRMWVMV